MYRFYTERGRTMLNLFFVPSLAYVVFQVLFSTPVLRGFKQYGTDEIWIYATQKDDQGFKHVNVTKGIGAKWAWILLPVPMLLLVAQKRGYVIYHAKNNAEIGFYNNNFAKASYRKIYDDAYYNG